MNTTQRSATEGDCCPRCSGSKAIITATVAAGHWERTFHECPECQLKFAGSWQNTHDQVRVSPATS